MSLEERFKAKVQIDHETGCHNWKGARNRKGYGMIAVGKGRSAVSHRISYQLYKGEIPQDFVVMHTCDNPGCVNPEHLKVGTHADNVADRQSKGRGTRGETHSKAKLTEIQVLVIKEAYTSGHKQVDIANYFGVKHYNINQIVHGRSWKHLCH